MFPIFGAFLSVKMELFDISAPFPIKQNKFSPVFALSTVHIDAI